MNPRPVAGISLDQDLPAPHGIPSGVSGAAMDIDSPAVHSIAGGFLDIAVNVDLRAIQVRSQRISRGARYRDFLSAGAAGKVPLSQTVLNYNILLSAHPKLVV